MDQWITRESKFIALVRESRVDVRLKLKPFGEGPGAPGPGPDFLSPPEGGTGFSNPIFRNPNPELVQTYKPVSSLLIFKPNDLIRRSLAFGNFVCHAKGIRIRQYTTKGAINRD